MLSPYRNPLKSNKTRQKTSSYLRRPQMTSSCPVVNSMIETVAPVKPVETKNKMKSGRKIGTSDSL